MIRRQVQAHDTWGARKPDHDDQPACNRMMERASAPSKNKQHIHDLQPSTWTLATDISLNLSLELCGCLERGGSEGKEGPTNVAFVCSPAETNLRPARQAIRFQVCSGSHSILTKKAARGVRTLHSQHGMVLRGAPLAKFS